MKYFQADNGSLSCTVQYRGWNSALWKHRIGLRDTGRKLSCPLYRSTTLAHNRRTHPGLWSFGTDQLHRQCSRLPFLTLIEAFFTVFALTLSGLVRILPGSTVLAFLLLVAVLELPCAAIIAAALPRAWLDRPCKTRRAAALSICALELPFSAIRTPGIAIPGRFLSR